jgi:subtilase family serine protease
LQCAAFDRVFQIKIQLQKERSMFTRPTFYASALALLLCLFVLTVPAPVVHAAGSAAPQIVSAVDETDLLELTGSTPPLAIAKFDRGAVADSLPMEHMFLVLRRSSAQEQAIEEFIAALHDPHSASFHQWLTADALGRKFGPAQEDIDTIVAWLRGQGFTVNLVHKSGLLIDISGTAGQVRNAFHTEIHQYNVNGEQHVSNSSDPKIPAAFAPVVVGFASLNNFSQKAMIEKQRPDLTITCTGCPDGFANQTLYIETPPDFATIYNVSPLYKGTKPITGSGQTVVVLEESDILAADVATFRKAFGLSSFKGKFSQIHPGPGCADPGMQGGVAQIEASLDAEWAGALAPNANVQLASCTDTDVIFGELLAAVNLLDRTNPPPIMSLSFGTCEAKLGPGGNGFFQALWQQADSEGVSAFVASGDSASAFCDSADNSFAVAGIGANGYASTPYNVAVGGTDFLATLLPNNGVSAYWGASNSPTGQSAMSYIPEIPWDDSCASSVLYTLFGFSSGVAFCNDPVNGVGFQDVVGGSGAPSIIYSKPSWQQGTVGVPTDGKRDLPDVSLFSSNLFYGQAIVFCFSDASGGGTPCDYSVPLDVLNNSAGGTSFAAPQFASIQALINQKAGSRQGNPNPVFYQLHKTEFGSARNPNSANLATCNATLGNMVGSACIFHDVTVGNNDVPCFGANNCFPQSATKVGVLSKSDTALQVAFPATRGWDFTSGLGSVNVTNLVNMWSSATE